jgi:hypothetical protein
VPCQNLAAKREVKFIHPAPDIPCYFYSFLREMYEVSPRITSADTIELCPIPVAKAAAYLCSSLYCAAES